MKRPGVFCLLTGLCLVLGGPTIGPCSAPNTTENFNDAYISKLTDGDHEVVHPSSQSSSTSQLRFYHNGTYLLTYIDQAGRSAQHTGEYRAQAHAASAPATITLHSLPSGAFGSDESGTVKLSVVRAEEGIIELSACTRAGLVICERRHLLISTMLHRSGVEAGISLNPVILDTHYANPDSKLGRQFFEFNLTPEARRFFIILAAINCLFNLFKKPDYCGSLPAYWKNATSNSTFYSALPSPPQTVLYNFEPVFATYPVPTYSWSRYALQPSAMVHNSMQTNPAGPVYAPVVEGIPYFAQYFENFGNREQREPHQSPQLVGAPITGQYNFFIPR